MKSKGLVIIISTIAEIHVHTHTHIIRTLKLQDISENITVLPSKKISNIYAYNSKEAVN